MFVLKYLSNQQQQRQKISWIPGWEKIIVFDLKTSFRLSNFENLLSTNYQGMPEH